MRTVDKLTLFIVSVLLAATVAFSFKNYNDSVYWRTLTENSGAVATVYGVDNSNVETVLEGNKFFVKINYPRINNGVAKYYVFEKGTPEVKAFFIKYTGIQISKDANSKKEDSIKAIESKFSSGISSGTGCTSNGVNSEMYSCSASGITTVE